jgi:hypothetical protein
MVRYSSGQEKTRIYTNSSLTICSLLLVLMLGVGVLPRLRAECCSVEGRFVCARTVRGASWGSMVVYGRMQSGARIRYKGCGLFQSLVF